FLTQSNGLCNHAQFVVDSLPNADLPAVKHQISLLEAIHHILESMKEDVIPHHLMDPILWHDVRKDCLEAFHHAFQYLEYQDLLDMDDIIHHVALFLVYHGCIQKSLDETHLGWNSHGLCAEGNRSPLLLWELSHTEAIHHGYWTGDPVGGDITTDTSDPWYGCDREAPLPPADELEEPEEASLEEERECRLHVNGKAELNGACAIMGEFDYQREDGVWGMDIYLEVVNCLTETFKVHVVNLDQEAAAV
ncbi:hypothetical protein BS47DRAFT_1451501, partial [Hydnum rufescens UP504]